MKCFVLRGGLARPALARESWARPALTRESSRELIQPWLAEPNSGSRLYLGNFHISARARGKSREAHLCSCCTWSRTWMACDVEQILSELHQVTTKLPTTPLNNSLSLWSNFFPRYFPKKKALHKGSEISLNSINVSEKPKIKKLLMAFGKSLKNNSIGQIPHRILTGIRLRKLVCRGKWIKTCPSSPHSNANFISFLDTRGDWEMGMNKSENGLWFNNRLRFTMLSVGLCLHSAFHVMTSSNTFSCLPRQGWI